MKKLLIATALVLALVTTASAETSFDTASVTNASQTIVFTTPRSSVVICNATASAGVMYFRLFNQDDSPAAATASHSPVAIGACISFSKSPSQSADWRAISLYSASTATANIYSE